jgi:guanylate kinase
MPELIMIAGKSGTGKTFLIEYLAKKDANYKVVQKKTTRSPRASEDRRRTIELIFNCDISVVKSMDYWYKYRTEYYGFNRTNIEEVFKAGKNPIMVIRSVNHIEELKEWCAISPKKSSKAILIQTSRIRSQICQKLSKQGNTKEEIMTRLDEEYESELERQYNENKGVFDFIVSNDYSNGFIQNISSIFFSEQR